MDWWYRVLLWQAYHNVKNAPNSSSPSWTWASTQLPWLFGPRILDLHTYVPGQKARILELTTTTSTGNPYAQVSSSCLRIEGLWRPLSHWTDANAAVYNRERWEEDMQIAHRWLHEDRDREAIPLKVPPPGRVVCTLDEKTKDPDTSHQAISELEAIVFQIARFSHQSSEPSKSGHKIFGSTAFALILQPTQRHEEYKRIGIAEIPTEDDMADGWDTKIVTIV
jgi:hypothetical protein